MGFEPGTSYLLSTIDTESLRGTGFEPQCGQKLFFHVQKIAHFFYYAVYRTVILFAPCTYISTSKEPVMKKADKQFLEIY